MRVLQLIQKPQPRGAEIFAGQLSEQLIKLGHNSNIIALFDHVDSAKYMYPYKLLHASSSSRLWDWQAWKNLAEIISIQKPDIIQANAGDTLKYAVYSKKLFGWQQPIIFRNASTLSSYIRTPLQKYYNLLLYNKVNAVASVSNHSKNDFVSLFPKLVNKITTIPIGLENKRETVNPFVGNSTNIKNLVHVGGFSFEKNHEGLLRIFKLLLKEVPDVKLWLIGDGPLREKVEKIIQHEQLEKHVCLTGFVNNPLDYIAHADVLLMPSIIEGLPGVILEALLYETPVVAYDVGGISEVIKSGETGWLVNAGEENKFLGTLINVLALDIEVKARISRDGMLLAKRHYLNEQVTLSFMNLYTETLKAYL